MTLFCRSAVKENFPAPAPGVPLPSAFHVPRSDRQFSQPDADSSAAPRSRQVKTKVVRNKRLVFFIGFGSWVGCATLDAQALSCILRGRVWQGQCFSCGSRRVASRTVGLPSV